MKKLLLALGILALICSPAMAGRNANGAMVVHTDDSIVYTATDYCASALPATCEELGTRTDKIVDQEYAVIWFVWAFRPESSPAVTTVQFGVDHNIPDIPDYWAGYAACGPGALPLEDDDWPGGGGDGLSGNLVAYSEAVFAHIFGFYWFAAAGTAGQVNYLGSGPYPSTGEAKFVDDSSPPVEDLCVLFGQVRWGEPGYNECPQPPAFGACCYEDGTCMELTQPECDGTGGMYLGDGTVCEPNPCPQPEACCFQDGSCEFVLAEICDAMGGTPWGPGTVCEPENPCPQPEGACCFADGSCEVTTEANCTGDYWLLGEVCDPNPCDQPTGACCFDDGSCTVTTEADCQGTLWIPGEDCDPNPCPTPVHESTTWGQIKANYR